MISEPNASCGIALESLTPETLSQAARSTGLWYRTGPFVVRLRTDLPDLLALLRRFYGPTWASTAPAIAHFPIEIRRASGLRGRLRTQAIFKIDDLYPFEPYPLEQSFPLMEWGLNWCIGTRAHRWLMLHAGVLERGGRALVLPGLSGSGKSTLAAALAHKGWRFLTDEIGLVLPETGELLPLPRAVPLKNRSIEAIREYLPETVLGPLFNKTRKGNVVHWRPTRESIERQQEPAMPRWIVFPRFVSGLTDARLQAVEPSLAFTRLAHNAFNYRLLGETGFHTLVRMVRRCDSFSLDYSRLETAVASIDALVRETPAGHPVAGPCCAL